MTIENENDEVKANDIELDVTETSADIASDLGLVESKGEGEGDEHKEPAAKLDKPAKEAKAPVAKETEATATPELDEQGQPKSPAKIEAPPTWRTAAKAKWDKIDPEIQQEILKRENDVHKGVAQYKQAADVGNGFARAVGKFLPLIQSQGLNPYEVASANFETHRQLAFGTAQQKVDAVRRLIKDFNVPMEGLTSQSAPVADHTDPVVKDLLSRIEALQSNVSGMNTAQQETNKVRILAEVEAFSKDPAHPLFEDVGDDIVSLLTSGACKTLQEAYDTAVARNPVARQKQVDSLIQQRTNAQKQADADRAAAARKSSAANVRSTSKNRGPTAPVGSMEDTLRSTAENLFSS